MARNRFTVPLHEVAVRTQGRLDETVRGATYTLFKKIVERTPVDSGKARANWNVSVGSPNMSTTESTSLSRSMAQVAKVKRIPAGEKVFMTNSLPYIRPLEYGLYPKHPKQPTGKTKGGYSVQAPKGMVRVSVREFSLNERIQKNGGK